MNRKLTTLILCAALFLSGCKPNLTLTARGGRDSIEYRCGVTCALRVTIDNKIILPK